MFLYSAFVLPEALTPERQKELMQANEATQESHRNSRSGGADDDSDDSEDGALETVQKRMNFTRKLQILLPKRDESTGKKDYRLLVLSIAFTIYRIGGLYTNDVSIFATACYSRLSSSFSYFCSRRLALLASTELTTAYWLALSRPARWTTTHAIV